MNKFKRKPVIGIKRKSSQNEKGSNGNANKKKKEAFFDINHEEVNEDDALYQEIDFDEKDVDEKEEIDETADEKRHRLAQEFIDKVGNDIGEESDEDAHIEKKIKDHATEAKRTLKKEIAASISNISTDNLLFKTLKGHKLPVTCAVLSSDNKFVYAASKDCCIIKWDVQTGRKIIKFEGSRHLKEGEDGHRNQILALALSSDGKYLASGGLDKKIIIWNVVDNKYFDAFKGHKNSVTALSFQKGTHLLYSGSYDRLVKIWNIDSMSFIDDLFGHQSEITSLDALFRERCLTSSYDKTLRFWKIPEESQLVFKGQTSSIDCAAMISEDTFISGSQDGSVCLWSTLKKKPISVILKAHQENNSTTNDKQNETNWITSVAACPFTDLVATGSNDGTIKLWRCLKFTSLVHVLSIPVNGFINSLCFNKEGTFLLAGIGQEHKLGRWSKIPKAKNEVKLFQLPTKESQE